MLLPMNAEEPAPVGCKYPRAGVTLREKKNEQKTSNGRTMERKERGNDTQRSKPYCSKHSATAAATTATIG